MSQVYPITGVTNTEIHPRLELRDLEKRPIQWSLFIQAFTNILNTSDSTQPNNWWQIGSIHGLPYNPWSGDPDGPQTEVTDTQWGGYCYHAAALFPPWHRLLLLLVEQAVVNEAIKIAGGLTNNKKEWLLAARSLRFPFWDWTRLDTAVEGIPILCQKTQVDITYADGTTASVPNPLNHYTFAGKTGAAKGAPYMATWTRTYRWANKDLNPTEENYNAARNAFAVGASLTVGVDQYTLEPLTWLRAKVAALFTYDLTVSDSGYGGNMWGYFSNTGAQDDNIDPVMNPMPPSIEEPHNQVHLHSGGNGSMSLNEYAGFDPIFFLHHCNVDRIYAFWEYVYPEYWIGFGWKSTSTGKTVPFVTDSGTFNQDSGTDVTQDTQLHPFRNKALDYWSSEETRGLLSTSAVNKYYTYPPIVSPTTGEEVNVHVPYDVNNLALRARYQRILYNEWSPALQTIIQQHQTLSVASPLLSRHVNLLLKVENQVAHLRHFFLVGEIPEFAYSGSYRLELYLLPKNPNQTEVHVVNSISVLGRADPDRCAACRGRRAAGNHVRGHMPLDPHLILHLLGQLDITRLAGITQLNHLAILIHGSFGVRLVKPDGTRLAAADPNLSTQHAPLDASKTPKLTLHSHVVQLNTADPAAGINFVEHSHHGAFGTGLQWRAF